ncbi:hypothetical protein CIL05_15170 [Virgibacillus profundi]|uniref:DUF4363 domain-containing protein n=1 Tax=Virgibacillus profundi TaxID=2024555 RepID=A0A2A2IBH1_9BACI|nr:membrane lipoprotein lipid attachment site-containing protein [Virgibacillus profundi]PAV28634.1 hypothetical protein CIL05_15170 [Virgibacillus profundi]PXY52802.1 DUF4363 domain-containing protein [Virgibacillus profundi]
MMKRSVFFLLILVILSGCTNRIGGDYFFEHITAMENQLEKTNWVLLSEEASKLKNMYSDNKWKLQLLGDETEYEGLHDNINKLIAAIDVEDQTETKVGLAAIESLLENIYSL